MAGATFARTDFRGGLWGKWAQGRFHDPRYSTALAACLNMMPVETGALVRRPGFGWAWQTRSGSPGRNIKFDFEEVTPAYTMEFTDGFLRLRSGAVLVDTNDDASVTSISNANPAVMLIGAAATWLTGAQGYFSGLSGNPLLENRLVQLTKVDTTHFSLTDAITGATIDGSLLSTIGSGVTFNRVLDIATPYIGGSWSSLRSVQSENTALLLQGNFPPQALTVETQPVGNNFATFNFGAAVFLDGPYLDPFMNGVIATPSAVSGIIQLSLAFPAYSSTVSYAAGEFVTSSSVNYVSLVDQNVNNTPASSPTKWSPTSAAAAINNGLGFLASDVGRLVRLYSEPTLWAAGTFSSGAVVTYNPNGIPGQQTYYQSLAASNTAVPGTDPTKWAILEQGGTSSPALWSWGRITSLLNIIPGAPAGIAYVGNMTSNGGLSAAFNGTVDQNNASSANFELSVTAAATNLTENYAAFIGQNFTGSSPASYAVASATITPPSDAPLFFFSRIANVANQQGISATAYLYGSNSAPTTPINGTLLGSTPISSTTFWNVDNQTAPVTVVSSDTVSTFAYLWVVIAGSFTFTSIAGDLSQIIFQVSAAQVEFVEASGSGATANGVNVEILGPALLYTNAIRNWRLGVYSGTTGYPSCGTFDSGRIWLAGSVPNRADSCCSSGITTDAAGTTYNFAPTDQYGNVLDSSAISITIDLPEANPLQWMIPDQQGILCGTKAREVLIFAPSSGGLTPTNIDARKLTRIGGANIEPVLTEHTIIFVQKFLRKIVEYFADVFSGKFTAPNLIQDAKQLTIGGLQELSYQQELAPVAWARVANGLIGCTYKRDTLMTSSGPNMMGWHDHTLGSGRDVESIVTGSSVNGNLDALTLVTNDTSTNIRFVEVLTDILDEGALLSEASYLDAAITPTSTSLIGISNPNFPYGGLQLNGLWPLNGKTVTAWLGGLDCGDYVVSNGMIQVPYGDGIGGGGGAFPTPGTNRGDQGLFTASFVATGVTANGQIMWSGTMPMRVGFTYTSQGQLTRPMQPAESGARNGPAFGKLARDHYIMLQLEGSQGISFGAAFDSTLIAAQFRESDEETLLTIDQQFTGIYRDQLNHEYGFDAMPCWQVTRPYICNVVAAGAAQETADI